ncbi:TAXI family TRAP transporter solute-binding subunit [Spiractinospora alimapuensis]|uniref:TAXI family TRAP transporter solute-binding subunit n=1 Tax=Spiractinospora alimapuensis TaxID=2820884 RepID=UPI001F2BFA0E|nr:TAXI family TRAP transporter solute-binding subunit [Spiractinospora alimapuensis]QVQ50065.1 TAXI family TRAP transporter solute-binding subunit [Spiractinospora alimapuensis]
MPRSTAARVASGVLALAVVSGLASVSWVWARHDAEPLPNLVLATGSTGGVYHVYGLGFARILEERTDAEITTVPTAASLENINVVVGGDADVGFSLADVAAAAVRGDPPFEGPMPASALARIYDNRTHLIVRADSPVERVEDLTGRVVSTGARDSGTEFIADRLLDVAGVDPEDDIDRRPMDLVDAAQALTDDEIDAFFWSGGLPTEAVTELAASTDVRLLDLGRYVEDLRAEHGDVYTEVSIPTGTYAGIPNVRTIGVPNLLVVADTMPDDVAESLTRLLFTSRPDLVHVHDAALQLNPRVAVATLPVPLHPGAAEYYRTEKTAYGATAHLPLALPNARPTATRPAAPLRGPRPSPHNVRPAAPALAAT